ncbi:hypothetical protein RND71_012041 [Anisodus tanguticus]|uniref:PIN-like protein n=1 Tax=Anisodus tanguticus TaxID=243964 RepID=A0AAE1SCG5_9SOLA|nr:hypothetical protein RND71_012041 [Anisodus tanguticus]
MLLIMIPAVYEEKNSPFGDSSTCSINGQAYASLSMAIVTRHMWTYVYNILQPHGIKHSTRKDSLESEAQLAVPLIVFEDMEKEPFVRRMKQHINIWAERINLKMLFAPSTIATIVGIIIGVVSSELKLHCTEATIPAVILIVGANLLRGLKKSEIGMCVVIGVQVVRYVALPLCGIVVVKAARHFGLVGSDPLYHFVLLLQYALASAMTIGTDSYTVVWSWGK